MQRDILMRMVADKNYAVLPKQEPHVVKGPDSPVLLEGEGSDTQEIRSVMFTDDLMVTWTTGEPGDVIPWHSHMPGMYQILTTIEGECIWHYKDNNGEKQSIHAGPGDVVFLPGGAENKVEVIGDDPHTHIGTFPRLRVPRIEHLVSETAGVYDPKEMPVGLWYDTMRDKIVKKDDNAFVE